MSGASPKHTKSGRHKACLGSCANSCHQEGTENLGGWADLGQTGWPETYFQDSCRGLSPAGVQTTPSTKGRDPPRPQTRSGGTARGAARGRPAGTSCGLMLIQHLASICQAPSSCSLHEEHGSKHPWQPPSEPPRTTLEARDTVGKQFPREPSEVGITPSSFQIPKLRSAIVCHLAEVTCGSQDSISALSRLAALKIHTETHEKANFTSQTQDTMCTYGQT